MPILSAFLKRKGRSQTTTQFSYKAFNATKVRIKIVFANRKQIKKRINQQKKQHTMTNEQPNVAKTGAYSIRETCEALGINRSTLRKYTDLGYIIPSHRRVGSRIFYTGMEIIRFWRVEVNGSATKRTVKYA